MIKKLLDDFKSREVRVFISSTFRDMQKEREYLVKKVFPALRKKFKDHAITITEVDLRWGVLEEEARNGRVIDICLTEVDKSRPYFIGLVGERYGWIPERSEYKKHKSIIEKYDWVKGDIKNRLSITEMEIQYGVLRNEEMWDCSFFYLRDPENEDSKEYREDESSLEFQKLLQLKRVISESPKIKSSGFSDIVELGDLIFNDLSKMIETDFPPIDEEDKMLITQLAYTRSLLIEYLPNENFVNEIINKLSIESFPIVIHDDYGTGKSSFVAYITQSFYEEDINAFFNFCGSTVNAADPIRIMERMLYALDNSDISTEEKTLNEQFEFIGELLINKLEEKCDRFIIIIDDLDQIKGELSIDFINLLIYMSQIDNVDVLVTCEDCEIANRFRAVNSPIIKLDRFDPEKKFKFITQYLNRYSKKLSTEEVNQISKTEITNKPLVLISLLNQLIQYGEFETLNNQILKFTASNSVEEFYDYILSDIEQLFSDQKKAVKTLLACLAMTKYGLPEIDLFNIIPVSRIFFNQIINSLDSELNDCSHRLKFENRYLIEAVEKRYINNNDEIESIKRKIISQLASKFDGATDNDYDDTREIAHLISSLTDEDFIFEYLSNFAHAKFLGFYDPNLFIRCWNLITHKYSPEEIYTTQNITQFLSRTNLESNEYNDFLTFNMFADYLNQLQCFNGAKRLYEYMLVNIDKSTDSNINCLQTKFIVNVYLINSLIELDLFDEAEDRISYLINDLRLLERDADVWHLRIYTSYASLYLNKNVLEKAEEYLVKVDTCIGKILEIEPAHRSADWMINAMKVKLQHFNILKNYEIAEEIAFEIVNQIHMSKGSHSKEYIENLIELATFQTLNGKLEEAIVSFCDAEITAAKLYGRTNNRYINRILKLTKELGI